MHSGLDLNQKYRKTAAEQLKQHGVDALEIYNNQSDSFQYDLRLRLSEQIKNIKDEIMQEMVGKR